MEKSLDKKLNELVINLVGQEARRIDCERREIKRYKPRNAKPISADVLDKTKREIYELFNGNYDEEIVRKEMMDYLDFQIEIVDENVNPSFKILMGIVERGEYNFDFSKHIEKV